jgi:hypothetical protein
MGYIIPVPSLSPSGWVTASNDKADLLFSHYFESNKSQTLIYGDNVSSIQYLLERYAGDITTLTQKLTIDIENYLGRYYDSVLATVTSDDTPSNLNGNITINIHCDVIEDGVQYSIGGLLEIGNSKIINFFKLNNG